MSRPRTSSTATAPRGSSRGSSTWLLPVVVVAVFVVLASVAVLTAGGEGEEPQLAVPTVSGQDLPRYVADGDPQGTVVPRATAPALLEDVTVELPVVRQPTIVLFLAHWCSHCQREVPVVQSWLDDGGLPAGVAVRAVATSIDPGRPNYPPDAWLEREGWTVPTLVDDGSIARAYGLTSFPFWAFVDADGRLVARAEGELGRDALASIADRLAP